MPLDEPSDDTESDDHPIVPLNKTERGLAFFFGSATLMAGTAATFAKGNDVGTGALLVGGVALVIMGIQGTPLIKIGGDKAAFELERRRMVAKREVERAAREESLEVASQVIEAVAKVEPRVQAYARQATSGLAFEDAIREVLLQSDLDVVDHTRSDIGWDFSIRKVPGRTVRVTVKWTSQPFCSRSVVERAFAARLNAPDGNKDPWVLVVNAPLNKAALAWGASLGNCHLVEWRGEADNDKLLGVIRAALSS
jgi:hypothetical protein